MLAHFFMVFGQVATLFFMMGVGVFFGKRGKIDAAGSAQMSHLLLYIACPCVILRSLHIENTPGLLPDMARSAGIWAIVYILCGLCAMLTFRRRDAARRTVLQFAMIYGNVGFMGIPLVTAVFGPRAALWGGLSLVVFSVFQWSQGMALMGGSASLKMVLLNPGVLSLAAGMALLLTGLPLPAPFWGAVDFLAGMNTPLAMIVVGVQIARIDLKSTFTQPALYLAAAFRLVAAPLAVALLLAPLGLDSLLYRTTVVLAATPSAGITAILAQRFERDAPLAAQLIALTTLLSLVTLPAFAVLAERLAG